MALLVKIMRTVALGNSQQFVTLNGAFSQDYANCCPGQLSTICRLEWHFSGKKNPVKPMEFQSGLTDPVLHHHRPCGWRYCPASSGCHRVLMIQVSRRLSVRFFPFSTATPHCQTLWGVTHDALQAGGSGASVQATGPTLETIFENREIRVSMPSDF